MWRAWVTEQTMIIMIWFKELRKKSQGHTRKLVKGLDACIFDDKVGWGRGNGQGHPKLK